MPIHRSNNTAIEDVLSSRTIPVSRPKLECHRVGHELHQVFTILRFFQGFDEVYAFLLILAENHGKNCLRAITEPSDFSLDRI